MRMRGLMWERDEVAADVQERSERAKGGERGKRGEGTVALYRLNRSTPPNGTRGLERGS